MSLPKATRLAVLIPARSEQETVGEVVLAVRASLLPIFPTLNILVIDDQSQDETVVRATIAGAHVVSTNRMTSGLGSAFRLGVQSGLGAGATTFLNIDADGQYNASEALRLLRPLADGVDLVIGNRLDRRPEWMSLTRYLGNRAYSRFWSNGFGAVERRLSERFPSVYEGSCQVVQPAVGVHLHAGTVSSGCKTRLRSGFG